MKYRIVISVIGILMGIMIKMLGLLTPLPTSIFGGIGTGMICI